MIAPAIALEAWLILRYLHLFRYILTAPELLLTSSQPKIGAILPICGSRIFLQGQAHQGSPLDPVQTHHRYGPRTEQKSFSHRIERETLTFIQKTQMEAGRSKKFCNQETGSGLLIVQKT